MFDLKNHGQIGRLEIMLNCEQNPEIIEQFIKTCSKISTKSYRQCNVYKILQDLYFESGDCTFENDGSGVESEKNKIYPRSYEKGKNLYAGTVSLLLDDTGSIVSNFSITLKKNAIFESQQIVIGRVVKGLDVLAALNFFGTRYGLPKKAIYIGNCGVLK
jgi:peptidylprolyl isomerase